MPATTIHHTIRLLMLDVEPEIEMTTEIVRQIVIPKGIAGIVATPPDTTAIDAARIMVGGEWHNAPTHTLTVHYITMPTNDGYLVHVNIPDGYTLLQRTLPLDPTSDDPQATVFTQYALVHTYAYDDRGIMHTIHPPPPDTTKDESEAM
jgi:hypothetical protein